MAEPDFHTCFAQTPSEIRAAQALRYKVFVQELGGGGQGVDHDAGLETDLFDAHSQHLLLLDRARGSDLNEQVVGVYRLLDRAGAQAAGRFYSETEFDLAPLLASDRPMMELGRSCLHPEYRGGMAMYYLWSALADHVMRLDVDILFGVASFHGTDTAALAEPLSLLHHRHLAPEALRPVAKAPCAAMDRIALNKLDRKAAMLDIPALIKAYLRLGGFVGEGAYIDHAFNTTDVCLVLDLAQVTERQRNLYLKDRSA